MSAHPAPRATRSVSVEMAGASGLALGPNQRGKAAGEFEASIPVMGTLAIAWMRESKPVEPNVHANQRGYDEFADAFEAIVDQRWPRRIMKLA